MIQFTCASCGQAYKVPADKAGVKAKCKKCSAIMVVPAQDGPSGVPRAAVTAAAPARQGDFHTHEDAGRDLVAAASASRRTRVAGDAGTLAILPGRPMKGDEEVRRRSMYVRILGIILMVAFFLPIVASARGRTMVSWVNLEGLIETGLPIGMRLLMVMPLLAGLFCYFGRDLEVKLRGIIMVVLGILPMILLFASAPKQIVRSIQQGMSMGGGGSMLMMLIAFLTLYGIMIGTRLRWYRPDHPAGYPIALTGAVAAALSLVIPNGQGSIGLIGPFQALKFDVLIGLVGILWMGILITVIVLICMNTPSTALVDASNKSIFAYQLFCYGFLIMLAIIMIKAMTAAGADAISFITVIAKMGAWMGATFMLVPMGVMDLLIGQPVTKPGLCINCGYDLRGATSQACPECGVLA